MPRHERIVVLTVAATGVHLVHCVYALWLATAVDQALTLTQRRVTLHPNRTDVYVETHARSELRLVSIAAVQAVISAVTALFHCGVYLPIYRRAAHVVWHEQQALWPRWCEYGITATLLSVASSVRNGAEDLNLAVVLLVGGGVLQSMGFAVEQLKRTVRGWRFFFGVGSVVQLANALPLVWYQLTARGSTHGSVLVTLTFVFYYTLFSVNCYHDARRTPPDFRTTDWNYHVLSLTSKTALFWMQVGEERTLPLPAWTHTVLAGLLLPLVVLVALVAWGPGAAAADRRLPTAPPLPAWMRAAVTWRLHPVPGHAATVPSSRSTSARRSQSGSAATSAPRRGPKTLRTSSSSASNVGPSIGVPRNLRTAATTRSF